MNLHHKCFSFIFASNNKMAKYTYTQIIQHIVIIISVQTSIVGVP